MVFLLSAVGLLPLAASVQAANVVRQDTSSAVVPPPDASSSVAAPPPPANTYSTAPAGSVPPDVPFSLITTNPTAFPLTDIVASPSTHATVPLETTYAPGSHPSISNAPPLPTPSTVIISSYPALDQIPPTDSLEVQRWMDEIAQYNIPDIAPSIAGGCPTNPDRVSNTSICWWTCGQCTRPTDITTCPDHLTWGLSFDDGPSPDTPRLLDYLAEKGLHSTFFVVGSRAISRQDILQAEYMAGHQLSVHTWSHPPLTTLTNAQIVAELGWTAKIIKDVTGVTPNTMRPPYGDIDDRVRAIAMAMGFTPIIWTSVGQGNFDTNDWHIAAGEVSASGVIAAFDQILEQANTLQTGFIVLAHDLYQQAVDLATGYILPDALARSNPSFKLMSIIECQHQPLGNAYIETNDNSTHPPAASSASPNPTATSAHQGAGFKSFSSPGYILGALLLPLFGLLTL